MTPGQKKLAAAGAVAISLGIGIAVLKKPAPQSLSAGYWYGPLIEAPCPVTPPGPNPYLVWTNPVDGKLAYIRYDAAVMAVATQVPDGDNAGFGGSDHSEQYYLDGMIVPIRGGSGYVYPAPWKDVPLYPPRTTGDITLCDRYRTRNGAAAKPCPSGQTMLAYSGSIKGTPQWSGSWAVVKPRMESECAQVPVPTKTPVPVATIVPPSLTKTPTAVPTPSPYADWIEQLSAEGITAGCQAVPVKKFCPGESITRQEAAVWALKGKHGATYVPPPCKGEFVDVPCK